MNSQSDSSIRYENVKQINFLKDMKRKNQGKKAQTLNFNSDRETITSIAQRLYKKIVRKGFIENAKQIAIPQTRKKIQTMYDSSDRWIDDSEVFTEAESESQVVVFSKFKAVSNMTIEEFYIMNNLTTKPKQMKGRKDKVDTVGEMMKDPLMTAKFQQLKKKIKQTILSSQKKTGSLN